MPAPAVRVIDRLVDLADVPATPASASLRRTGDGAAWEAVVLAPQASLDAHTGASAGVHGIADTSQLVVTSDVRLSNARTPTAHKATHELGGSDVLTALTDASFAAANKDGASNVASLRTLGGGAGQAAPGSGPLAGSVNTTSERVLVTPMTSSENGVVVKSPNSAWGDETVVPYGSGQAFMLLKEDTAGAVVPDDLVLYRVNRAGDFGTGGGMHVATGLRQRAGYSQTQCVWVNPSIDTDGIIIEGGAAAPVSSYLICETGPGGAGIVFEVKGSGKAEYNVPQARVFNSAAITLTTGVAKALTFDSERFDTANVHSTVANTDRLVAPVSGVYIAAGSVEFAASAVGLRQVYISSNRDGVVAAHLVSAASSGTTQLAITSGPIQLDAGQYVNLVASQTSGGNLNVTAAAYSPFFSLTYVGRGQ